MKDLGGFLFKRWGTALSTVALVLAGGNAFGQALKDCDVCPELVSVPAARFTIGSPKAEKGRETNEGPETEVRVSAFLIGKTEVTQAQWRAIMGNNPSRFKECGDNCPVESVSWNDVQEFLKKLSDRTGKQYRLPSEAEWEYAARAGTNTRWSFGDDVESLGRYAWFTGNAAEKTQPVAQKKPNAWGLFDMHGNVWEWTQDVWHDDYNGLPLDGSAWVKGGEQGQRVLRGGSWSSYVQRVRSAIRNRSTQNFRYDYTGLRVVRAP